MATNANGSLDSQYLFKTLGTRTATREYQSKETIYLQGDKSTAMFFIRSGNVKLTATSKTGKKAIIAILHHGEFFGEGCLSRGSLRRSTATAIETSIIAQVNRSSISRSIHREPSFAKSFVSHMAHRISRIEESFVDQIFSSSEQRLARVLLVMAGFRGESEPEPVQLNVSQETLAEMVGTTRSRVSYFMNRFRDRGFIDYNGTLQVHPSLLAFLTNNDESG